MANRLNKGDESRRRQNIIKASRNGDVELTAQLIALLQTKESRGNKRHAVRALGNIGGERARTTLLELLNREDGIILGDIAHALGQIRCRSALPGLKRLADHKLLWVRQNVAFAITEITKKP
jgi:HEAT repeat protein